LEAATSRLEDLAVANTNDFKEAHAAHRNSATPSVSKDTSPQFNTGVFTPEARASMVEEPIVEVEKSPILEDYEKLVNDLVNGWVAKSEKIGQVVGEQVNLSSSELMEGSSGPTFIPSATCISANRTQGPTARVSSGTDGKQSELTGGLS
jgi:hypothetical protein